MYLNETRPTQIKSAQIETKTAKPTKATQQDPAAQMMAAFQTFMAADFIDEIAANVAKESVYLVATANENEDALEACAA